MINADIPYNYKSSNPIEEYAEVRKSKIHGFGLFAKQKIPKGTVWWHARPQDVVIISKNQFETIYASYKSELTKKLLDGILSYSYYERNLDALILCMDNSRYVNHSFSANSGASEDENGFSSVALRDIDIGEEITEDYSKYTLCSWIEKEREYFDPTCW